MTDALEAAMSVDTPSLCGAMRVTTHTFVDVDIALGPFEAAEHQD